MENLNLKQQLTEHFVLSEFTKSNTARRLNIANIPSNEVIENLRYGCAHILEPLRAKVGIPIKINSGYRCEHLNRAVGGVQNSYHLKGCAADIHLDNNNDAEILFQSLKLIEAVDVCLFEHAGASIWLHVQWRPNGNPRRIFNYNFKANVL